MANEIALKINDDSMWSKVKRQNTGQLPLTSITTLINKTKFILLVPFCWQVFTDVNKGLFRSVCVHAQSVQPCPTLCDPMDCSPPGSSVHGILQARILEWGAMPSAKG